MSASSHPASVWSSARRVAAMRKWHDFWAAASREATDLVLAALPSGRELHLLDLACGSGEPALSLAAAVGPRGSVTATDISRDILSVAEENARRSGANIRFEEAVAEALPFPRAAFDAVTCRFGAMFFTDVAKAFSEVRRVLRPGGRAIFLAWALGEQGYFDATIEVVRKYAGLAEPRESLDIYRFGRPGSLAQELRRAGFARVADETRPIRLAWPGPPEQVWSYFRESSANFGPVLDTLPPAVQEEAAREARAALEKYRDRGSVVLPGAVVVATGCAE